MNSTAHIAPEDLTSLLDGELSDEERVPAEAHLARCGSCRAEFAEMQGLVSLLRDLPQYKPPRTFTLSPEQVVATRWRAWQPKILRFTPAARSLSVAAVIVFLVVTGFVFVDRTNDAENTSGDMAPMGVTGTVTPTDASKQITGDSDADTSGLVERGDSAANNSAPPAPGSGESAAAAADIDDVAQTTASPGVRDAVPEETPVSVATTGDSDDDDGSWLMTSIGLGALAIVLVGLWLVLVRMGRSQRRTA